MGYLNVHSLNNNNVGKPPINTIQLWSCGNIWSDPSFHIWLQLRYPDSEVQLVVPRLTDFRQQNPQSHSITTDVVLNHGLWTEPSYVELSIVSVYPADPDMVSSETLSAGLSKATSHSGGFDYIELCAPVKVNLEPKQCRRWDDHFKYCRHFKVTFTPQFTPAFHHFKTSFSSDVYQFI